MLVVLEGLDGTGKTTLLAGLQKLLPALVGSKEPGTPLHSLPPTLRDLVLSPDHFITSFVRELLFCADAAIHKETLERIYANNLVVSDRGYFSHLSYAYALNKGGMISDKEYATLLPLYERCCSKPNALIYLRGNVELMGERLKGKKADVIESLPPSFFANVQMRYEQLVEMHDAWPILELDAALPEQELRNRSLDFILNLLD